MFCKKCGSAVRDGAGFCPKCGARINAFAGGGMKSSDSMETSPGGSPGSFSTQTGPSTPKAPSVGTGNRKVLLLAGGAIVLVIVLFLLIRGIGGGREYPLEGTWTSEDASKIENARRELLVSEAGLDKRIVDTVMESTGAGYPGDVSLTFSENGMLWFGGGGVAVSIGSFSYEKLSDRALMLKYSLSLPIVGEISASYQASYSVSKDRLTLDLFGIRTTFKRQ